MEFQKTTKLPDGVGKKIVEALKNQSFEEENDFEQDVDIDVFEEDVQLEEIATEEDFENSDEDVFEEISLEQNSSGEVLVSEETVEEISENIEVIDVPNHPIYNQPEVQQPQQPATPQTPQFVQPQYVQPQHPAQEVRFATDHLEEIDLSKFRSEPPPSPSLSVSIPDVSENLTAPNVEVLTRLVAQLPPGVTRQTGAQIIRQTLEAMGISMNKVLAEAQMVQESLGHSVRNNVNKIEEFKTNIKILEGEVKSYKVKADNLEDLINLFILSEK